MKKQFIFVLITMLLFSIVAAAEPNIVKKDPEIDKKVKQLKILEKFNDQSDKKGKELKIHWNEKKGIPDFITGQLSDESVRNEMSAVSFLEDNKDLFDVTVGSFEVKKTITDNLGMKHYRTQLLADGIPVYGTEIIVHTDKSGNVYSINGQVEADFPAKLWKKQIKINENQAFKSAEDEIGLKLKKEDYSSEPTSELYLYKVNKEWQPVYLVTLQFIEPYLANWKIFVNAETSKVVDKYNAATDSAAIGTGVGVHGQVRSLNTDYTGGTYYLKDTTRGAQILTYNGNYSSSLPGTLMSDTDNNFNASAQYAGVDAHYYTGLVYDYYKNKFNRNSYDNNGAALKSTVHYGSNYNNAGWNGVQMIYGDGDGVTFGPFSGAFDVIAHELQHAVTEHTANLEYRSQPGALNESFSDIFGYFVEGDANDWLMGEDCYTPGTPGDALRSFQDPTLYNQPAHMNDYETLPETQEGDWGGVHINSGIPNKAFYNIATTINNNSKVEQIYYRALTVYLTSTSVFTDARNALVQAAVDLHGSGSTEAQAVSDGFAAVGIAGTSSDPDGNSTMGTAEGPISSGEVINSYISSTTDVDYFYFNTASAGTITITLSNLPGDYELYLYNESGSQIGKSENGSTNSENISYSASNAGKFYVKVLGYNGAYSTTVAYALKATYPSGSGGSYQWYYENVSIDTPHNYSNNYNATYDYSKPGASKVAVHFSQFETESGYDFVYIKDKNGNVIAQYDGTKSAFWAIVDEDKITVNLVSDYSVTAYGYHIDQVGYYSNTQLAAEGDVLVTDELLTPEEVNTLKHN
ncbi:MAG: M4 family metallopeptidase [Bacillota bacterium]